MTPFEILRTNCRQATLLIEKKGDNKISFSEKIGLWWHTLHCSLCRLFFKQSEMIAAEARKTDEGRKPATLQPEKKKQIAESLTNQMKRNA